VISRRWWRGKGLQTTAAAACLLWGGCTVGPEYHRPAVEAPTHWQTQGPWRGAQPHDGLPKGNWWTLFGDAELNQYEAQALSASPTLAGAAARLTQARDFVRITQSGLFPQLTAAASAERQRVSANRPSTGTVPPTAAVTQSAFTIPFTLAWETDLFGGVRRSVEAANAQLQSTAADTENVRLVVTSELAADYFSLRETDAEIAAVKASVELQQKALDLVQSRHAGGVASGLDVAQQQTLLDSTRTQVSLLAQQRAQFEHAIAVLAGVPASTFHVAVRPLTLAPPAIPVGVPSGLLERRPDIAAAERQMAAANAGIGVVRSAFFPDVTLAAAAGLQSRNLASLFDLSSTFWALGVSAVQDVFNGGRNRARLDFAQAGYQATVADYRQTVLVAFQQVEDGLSGLNDLAQAAATQQAAVADAQRALDLANNRYTGGLDPYINVITEQQNLVNAQRLAAQLLGQRLVTSVFLIKALGGGWNASALQTVPLRATANQAFQP